MEEILCREDGETLENVDWRSCGCPISASVQGQTGGGFENPGLVSGSIARGLELDVPSNPNHAFIL